MPDLLREILDKQFVEINYHSILLSLFIGNYSNSDSVLWGLFPGFYSNNDAVKKYQEFIKEYYEEYTEYEIWEKEIVKEIDYISFNKNNVNKEIINIKNYIKFIQILSLQFEMESDIIPFVNDFLQKLDKNNEIYDIESINENEREEEKFYFVYLILVVKLFCENYTEDTRELLQQYDTIIEHMFYEYVTEKKLSAKYKEEVNNL